MSRSARMPRRTLTAPVLLSAALLSTGACSPDGDSGPPKQQPVRTTQPSQAETDPATDSDEADVNRVLDDQAPVPATGRVILRHHRTQGSAHLEFAKARKGEGNALTVAVSCEGKGTIEVRLRPGGISFPMDCLDNEVTTIENQFTGDDSNRAGTVSVTAPSGVRWSLSLGRGEPTEQDLDG